MRVQAIFYLWLLTVIISSQVYDLPRSPSGHRKPSFVWIGVLQNIKQLQAYNNRCLSQNTNSCTITPEMFSSNDPASLNSLLIPPTSDYIAWLKASGIEAVNFAEKCNEMHRQRGPGDAATVSLFHQLFYQVMAHALATDDGLYHTEVKLVKEERGKLLKRNRKLSSLPKGSANEPVKHLFHDNLKGSQPFKDRRTFQQHSGHYRSPDKKITYADCRNEEHSGSDRRSDDTYCSASCSECSFTEFYHDCTVPKLQSRYRYR